MVSIIDLWLPILVGAVFVFLGSSIVHMVLPIHRNDFKKLPDEEAVLAAMREADVEPGDYFFPHCAGPAEMKDPEVKARFDAGPVGTMTVQGSGMPPIGKNLIQWFIYSIVVGIFVAYLAGRTIAPGAGFAEVLQIAGAVAFLAYAGAEVQASIWWRRSWMTTLKMLGDGLFYGILTGIAFGWLWP